MKRSSTVTGRALPTCLAYQGSPSGDSLDRFLQWVVNVLMWGNMASPRHQTIESKPYTILMEAGHGDIKECAEISIVCFHMSASVLEGREERDTH